MQMWAWAKKERLDCSYEGTDTWFKVVVTIWPYPTQMSSDYTERYHQDSDDEYAELIEDAMEADHIDSNDEDHEVYGFNRRKDEAKYDDNTDGMVDSDYCFDWN